MGIQTTQLIHENIHVSDVHTLEEYVLDADVIEDIFNHPDPKKTKQLQKMLIQRFQKHVGDPKFKKLSELLEELRDKAEKGLEEALQEKSPQAALTELFLELKTEQTPAVVERIVADIDAIVRVVQKSLRKALLKYQLHKDQALFDRA